MPKPWRYQRIEEAGPRWHNYRVYDRASGDWIGEIEAAYDLFAKAPHWVAVNRPGLWDYTRDAVAQVLYNRHHSALRATDRAPRDGAEGEA